MGLINVLIEGGSRVNAEALRSGVVDKVAFFIAPKILGGDDARGSIGGSWPESLDQAIPLYDMRFTRLGEDVLVEGLLKKPDEDRPEIDEKTDQQDVGSRGKRPTTAGEGRGIKNNVHRNNRGTGHRKSRQ